MNGVRHKLDSLLFVSTNGRMDIGIRYRWMDGWKVEEVLSYKESEEWNIFVVMTIYRHGMIWYTILVTTSMTSKCPKFVKIAKNIVQVAAS